jgi:hypothetical protein
MTTSQNFALQGLTLNGNTVVQYNGMNIYLRPDGLPIRNEKAWFEIKNPKRILAESAEYLLRITRNKMLREGLYFIGNVQKFKDGHYEIRQWDHTYIMLSTNDIEKVVNFIFENAYYYDEIVDMGYIQIAHKVPFDRNGIIFKDDKLQHYGCFYKEVNF